MISEDVISEISEQEIQGIYSLNLERIDSLKRVLDREKEEILKEVSKEIEDFLSKSTQLFILRNNPYERIESR